MTTSADYTTRRQRDYSQRTGDDGIYTLLAAVVDLARRDAALDPDAFTNAESRTRARRNRRSAQAFLQDLGISIVPVSSN